MAMKKSARRGRERRGSERAAARLSMRVEAGATGAARIVTESQNISASGVYCHASHYLAPLSKVQITIVLPRTPGAAQAGQEFVKCDGIVVRCDQRPGERSETPYELACMFTGLDLDMRRRLDEFVTWRNLQALRAALAPAPRAATAAPRAAKAGGSPARAKTPARKAPVRSAAGKKPAVRAANTSSERNGAVKPSPRRRAGATAKPAAPRNAGTTLRLLAGIVAAQPFETSLTGDDSLSRRPMLRIAEPLTRMGAAVSGRGDACTPPLTVRGGGLHGIDYAVPMASAQVATCTLLAGLGASGETRVTLPGPARDHTERMLPAFGVALEREPLANGGRALRVRGGALLEAADVRVPGDFSAAAFFFAAAAAEPGARVTARGVNLNPTRTGFLDVLRAMGAGVTVEREWVDAGEPAGDVTVGGPASLVAFDVPADWLPRMVDEAPAWAVVAAAARGTSRLTGAAELRVKESDRIASLAAGLGAVGIAVVATPDGLAVTGGTPRGATRIATQHDHRIAMAFAALGCRTREPVWFDDLASVATSYPGFFDTLVALGGEVVPDPSPEGGA